jgi:hypothetical protein
MRRLTIVVLTALAAALAVPALAEEERVLAIQAAAGIADAATIKLVSRGLRDRSVTVRMTAIESLGKTKHKDAVKALRGLYFQDMPLRDDEALLSVLLKEIGRHGDPSTLDVFADRPFKGLTVETGRARAYGLAMIRDERAVELLFKALQLAGGDPRGGRGGSGNRFRGSSLEGKLYPDIRVCIAVLTGRDPGRDKKEAVQWWVNEAKKKAKVEPQRPEIPEPLAEKWSQFWGEAYYEGRPAPEKKPLGSPYVLIESPDKDTVKAAVEGLGDAMKSKDVGVRLAGIEQYGGVADAAVTRLVAKGLRDREMRVQVEAIDCLGWSKDPGALKQLHRLYRRDKKLRDNEVIFTALLRAIGRHRDKSSLDVLRDSPFKGLTIATGQARIFGIANIRTNESVESLIKGMSLGGGDPRGNRGGGGSERFMVDMRVALFVLTGEDHGTDKDAWFAWWRENKKKWRISPDRPKLPKADQATWELYWNEAY